MSYQFRHRWSLYSNSQNCYPFFLTRVNTRKRYRQSLDGTRVESPVFFPRAYFFAVFIRYRCVQPLLLNCFDCLDAFLENVRESIAKFRACPQKALKKWAERYPVPFTAEELKGYYDSLDYEFTDERKKSLQLYFNLCVKEEILSESPTLRFL